VDVHCTTVYFFAFLRPAYMIADREVLHLVQYGKRTFYRIVG